MPVHPKSWIFTQLYGARRTLTLANRSAPHGRPRKAPVVTDAIELRESETYYTGNDIPTRHIFGTKCEPWELNGRFEDSEAGPDYARTKTSEVKSFIVDSQPVAITWGDILSATGLIKSFKPARESEAVVAWTMTILIDQDESNVPAPPALQAPNPVDQTKLIIAAMPPALAKITQQKSFKPGFLESLENAVASVNSAVATVTSAVSKIDTFEKAVVGDIKRLRAGIGQLQTASQAMQGIISSASNDTILVRRSAEFDNDWMAQKVANEIEFYRIYALMWAVDRQAEIAERGKTQSSYVAQLGDSWESISTKLLGGPDKAQTIRDINGIKYGSFPQPGTTYKVPVQ